MWKKIGAFCLGLLVTLLIICGGSLKASAKDITSSTKGLSAADAIINEKTSSGLVPVDSTADLEAGQNYDIQYKWSLADGVKINAGDTATVTLPETASYDPLSFEIEDDRTHTYVGDFYREMGDKTGTITFNKALSTTNVGRAGSLHFAIKGTKVVDNSGSGGPKPGYVINKVGWVGKYSSENSTLPDQLVWDMVFNVDADHMGETTVTDTLGINQVYNPGSTTVSYKDASGNTLNTVTGSSVEPTVAGQILTFHFDDVTTSVKIDYTTTALNQSGTYGSLSNDVAIASANGITGDPGGNGAGTIASPAKSHADIDWGGDGLAHGDFNGSAILTKTNAAGEVLKGAEYELYNSNNVLVGNATATDENGQLVMKGLPEGSYYFKEVAAPDGYLLNTKPSDTIDIVANGTSEVKNVSQTDEKNGVTFTKTDSETGQVVPGATYDLYNGTGIVKSGLKTDANGQIQVTDLAAGDYYFKETDAPVGYEKNDATVPFTMTSTMTAFATVSQKDTPIKTTGSAILTKTGSDTGYGVPGAMYELLADDQKTVVSGPQETDASGKITVTGLASGTYYFKETQAPDGYYSNSELVPVMVDANSTTAATAEQTDTAVPTEPVDSSSSSVILSSSSSALTSSSSLPSSSSSIVSSSSSVPSSSSSVPSSSSSSISSSSSSVSSSSSSISSSSSSVPSSSSSSISTSSSSVPSSSSSSVSTSSSSTVDSSSSSTTTSSSSVPSSSSSTSTSSSTPSVPSSSSSTSSSSSMTSSNSSSSSAKTSTSSTSTGSSSADVVTGGVPVTGLDQSSSSSTMGGGTGAFAHNDSATSSSTTAKDKPNRYLPQTNEEKSAGVLLAGVLLLGFGTSLWRLRQHRD